MGCTERRKGNIRVDRLEGEVRWDLGERIFGREVREGGQRDMGFQFCPLIQQAATGSRIETARRRDFKESGRSNSRKVEESLNSDEIKVEIQRQLEEGRKKLLTEVAVQLEKEKEAAPAVLDNVKNSSQIEALIGKQPSFGGGSRIILTTRDKQSLRRCMIYQRIWVAKWYNRSVLKSWGGAVGCGATKTFVMH
ncbi:uncharacterized protein LOC103946284 [Pyrus x bretschneideri]|uniref:uncharacterized protein LOC103946284 n=1 Tax=Pyrus x bretschneideri TaxID=225117 RepID=UPI002030BA52|nr:uncharacterized protein LOC103946284 [Pyrus x bretschneideri]